MMNAATIAVPTMSPLMTRLAKLATLEQVEVASLRAAERDQRRYAPRRELMAEGDPIRERAALLSGWACRQRDLPDGRRQILNFLVPGDLIGMDTHRNPLAATTVLAITEVVTCALPPAGAPGGGLAEAYAVSTALEQHYLLAHITRLGRLSAYERLADWFLETQDRLDLAGLATGDRFPLPLTQEMLADALGLTSVHINRTLQAMRRDGVLIARSGVISLPDRDRLKDLVDYRPARISSEG